MAVIISDDFSTSTLDTSKWTTVGTPQQVTPDLRLFVSTSDDNEAIIDKAEARLEQETTFDFKKARSDSGTEYLFGFTASAAPANHGQLGVRMRITNTGAVSLDVDSTYKASIETGISTSVYHRFKVRIENSTFYYKRWLVGDAEPESWSFSYDLSTSTVTAGQFAMWFSNTWSSGSYADGYLDNVVVSSLAPPVVNDSFDADTPAASLNVVEPVVSIEMPARVDVDTSVLTAESHEAVVETTENIDLTLDTAAINLDAQDDEASGGMSIIMPTAAMSLDVYGADVSAQFINMVSLAPVTGGQGDSGTPDRFKIMGGQSRTMTFDLPNDVTSESLLESIFSHLVISRTTAATNYKVKTITSTSPVTYSTEITVEAKTSGVTKTNIASIFDPNNFHGIVITNPWPSSYQITFASSTYADPASRPVLSLTYETIPASSETIVGTPTISTKANDVAVATPVDTAVDGDTAALTVDTNEPVVEAFLNPNAEALVETATLTLAEPTADAEIPVAVDVDNTDTVMFGAYDVEISTTIGEVVQVNTPEILVTHHQVTDVNGEPVLPSETEDPYFESTWRTLAGIRPGISGSFENLAKDAPLGEFNAEWFRFNERSGTEAYDRAYATNPDGSKLGQDILTLSNVVIGLNNGPDGRHNVHFNGDAYALQVAGGDAYYKPSGVEFTIRTERKTQFLMGGSGIAEPSLYGTRSPTWELWLVDGRLETREYSGGQITASKVVRGFKDIADGEWHHVVIQQSHEGSVNQYRTSTFFAVEFYVDARLDVRRRTGTSPMGLPDHIGGRADLFYDRFVRAPALDKAHWFKGDLTELVYRNGRVLNDDEIAVQRDNVMGIRAVHVDSADTDLVASETISAKGNKPRVLVLDFGGGSEIGGGSHDYYGVFDTDGQAILTASKMQYVPEPANTFKTPYVGYGDIYAPQVPSYDTGIALRFIKPAFGYRDAVTDNYRMIDLENDINMDDYDVISFIRFPKNSQNWSIFDYFESLNAPPYTPLRKQLEDLMVQVKEQVKKNRKSLYLTDPFSAIALGIIDKVDYVPNFKERAFLDNRLGANTGTFDWHAMRTDPFYGSYPGVPVHERVNRNTISDANRLRASRYFDTHSNMKQRVRAVIEGLTDVPSWILTDRIEWWNVNPMANPPFLDSYAYEQRPFGLNIGDEFYMEGGWAEESPIRLGFAEHMARAWGWTAAPVDSIKVGTAVTTFSNVFFGTSLVDGDEAIGNPYQNHAVSIAIQPGDAWDGEYVTGKVYVNFTEAWTHNRVENWNTDRIAMLTSRYAALSDGEISDTARRATLAVGDVIEYNAGEGFVVTEEHIRYQKSRHWGEFTGSEIPLPNTGGSGPDWGWSAGGTRNSGGGMTAGAGEAMSWRWEPKFWQEQIDVPTMAQRALRWLFKDIDNDGNANVNVGTAEVTTEAHDISSVEVENNTVVDVSTARVHTEAYTDADTVAPDVTVMVGTPSVTVRPSGVQSDYTAETPNVSLVAPETNAGDFYVDWDNALVVTLPRQSLTLIMEDA